jgi:ketosteroid isomerase-like protein
MPCLLRRTRRYVWRQHTLCELASGKGPCSGGWLRCLERMVSYPGGVVFSPIELYCEQYHRFVPVSRALRFHEAYSFHWEGRVPMTRFWVGAALALCLATAGCSKGVDVEAQRLALLDADRAWASAAAAGDLDQVFPFWTEDAVIYPVGMPVVRGKAAIREFVATNRAQQGFSITWEPLEAVVSQDGSLGYTVGDYKISVDGTDAGNVVRNGRYLETWRKDEAGSWRCALEIQSPLTLAGGPDLRPEQPTR